jgi:hypothetical protein
LVNRHEVLQRQLRLQRVFFEKGISRKSEDGIILPISTKDGKIDIVALF